MYSLLGIVRVFSFFLKYLYSRALFSRLSLFNFQGPSLPALADSLYILSHLFFKVKRFSQLFSIFFKFFEKSLFFDFYKAQSDFFAVNIHLFRKSVCIFTFYNTNSKHVFANFSFCEDFFNLALRNVIDLNTVGNLENVGFSLEGHEGLYNIFMMEEVQSIFAVGAGAVTKLVKAGKNGENDVRIERIFNPKYPYEYLKNDSSEGKKSFTDKVLEFYNSEK